jgi:hypothetical protein
LSFGKTANRLFPPEEQPRDVQMADVYSLTKLIDEQLAMVYEQEQRLKQIEQDEIFARGLLHAIQSPHNEAEEFENAQLGDDPRGLAMISNAARASDLWNRIEKNKQADAAKFEHDRPPWDIEDERIRQLKTDAELARTMQLQWYNEQEGQDVDKDETPSLTIDDKTLPNQPAGEERAGEEEERQFKFDEDVTKE